MSVVYDWLPVRCLGCKGIGHYTQNCRRHKRLVVKKPDVNMKKRIWMPKKNSTSRAVAWQMSPQPTKPMNPVDIPELPPKVAQRMPMVIPAPVPHSAA